MSIIKSLISIEKKYPWAIIGVFLTVVFAVGTLIYQNYMDNYPRIIFQIESNTPVLDVKEKLSDLEVFYKGEDITINDQILSVVIVKMINPGSSSLLIDHYDVRHPVGLKLDNGKILRSEIIKSNDSYLSDASILRFNNNTMKFEPVILDPNDYVLVKVLALHSKNDTPKLSTFGKVAGIKSIKIENPIKKSEDDFLNTTFGGSYFTQISRIIIYPILLILSTISGIWPVIKFIEWNDIRKKNNLINNFIIRKQLKPNEQHNKIFDIFRNSNFVQLKTIYTLLLSGRELNKRINAMVNKQNEGKYSTIDVDPVIEVLRHQKHPNAPIRRFGSNSTRKILEMKLARLDGTGIWVPIDEVNEIMGDFVDYIDNNTDR